MTTFLEQRVRCARCGKTSEQEVLASTNAFGSPDLDLRPPEMERSTMGLWLQLCPECGYVAPDLSALVGKAETVRSPEYRGVLDDTRYPELARRFLAYGLLCGETDAESAALSRLHAAWVCDDAEAADRALECRNMAAAGLSALKPFDADEEGLSRWAVLVDVLRRAGRFGDARAECEALLKQPRLEGIIRDVIQYQQRLIAAGDTAAHLVEECQG